MLNNYVKTRGIASTIVRENNHSQINETKWDADYDGDVANIVVDTNNDGKLNHYKISLDNEDLANILTLPSVNVPLEQRLQMDYGSERVGRVEPMRIELPSNSSTHSASSRISSPGINEELVVPLTIGKDSMDLYTLTPRRRHRRRKTHVTHKVYKKLKSSKTRSKRSSKRSLRR